MANELLTPTEYALKAESQRQHILDSTIRDKVLCLTAEEWRRVSCTWLLVSRGVYLPDLEKAYSKKILKQLFHENVRTEVQNYIRLNRITLEIAADAMNCKAELKEFYDVEDSRPILTQTPSCIMNATTRSIQTPSQRRPAEHVPQRTCSCTRCGNRIYGHSIVAKVHGKVICSFCSDSAVWNAASQKWEWK